MENALQVNGSQIFMSIKIPVISGGFGANKKCMTDKTISEIHNMKAFKVRELIDRNIKRFKESIDFIDLKQRILLKDTLETDTNQTNIVEEEIKGLMTNLGYAKQAITQANHIYLLSERGYSKLIKIMDTDLAWEIHDKLMDEYFYLRDINQDAIDLMIHNDERLGATQIWMARLQSNLQNQITPMLNDLRIGQDIMFNQLSTLLKQQQPTTEITSWIKSINPKLKEITDFTGMGRNTILHSIYKRMGVQGYDLNKRNKEQSTLQLIDNDPELKQAFMDCIEETLSLYHRSQPPVPDNECEMQDDDHQTTNNDHPQATSEPIQSQADKIREVIAPLAKLLNDTSNGYTTTFRKVYANMSVSWSHRQTRFKNKHGHKNKPSKYKLLSLDSKLFDLFSATITKMMKELI